MNGLEVTKLKKRYGDVTVVDDLSFSVKQGEVFGLIGPNGAGKSTTMMMIIGLLKSDGGSIKFDGQLFNPRDPEMRCHLGIVPHHLSGRHRGARHGPAGGGGAAADATLAVAAAAHGAAHSVGFHRSC